MQAEPGPAASLDDGLRSEAQTESGTSKAELYDVDASSCGARRRHVAVSAVALCLVLGILVLVLTTTAYARSNMALHAALSDSNNGTRQPTSYPVVSYDASVDLPAAMHACTWSTSTEKRFHAQCAYWIRAIERWQTKLNASHPMPEPIVYLCENPEKCIARSCLCCSAARY